MIDRPSKENYQLKNQYIEDLSARLLELNERCIFCIQNGSPKILYERTDLNGNVQIDCFTPMGFKDKFINQKFHYSGRLQGLGRLWLESPGRREVNEVIFRPVDEPYPNTYNLWKGFATQPLGQLDFKERCSLAIKHLFEVACSENEEHFNYLISWIAHLFQNPAKKPPVAVVFHGEKGVGKTIIADILKQLIGHRQAISVSNAKQLTSNFNAHLE